MSNVLLDVIVSSSLPLSSFSYSSVSHLVTHEVKLSSDPSLYSQQKEAKIFLSALFHKPKIGYLRLNSKHVSGLKHHD